MQLCYILINCSSQPIAMAFWANFTYFSAHWNTSAVFKVEAPETIFLKHSIFSDLCCNFLSTDAMENNWNSNWSKNRLYSVTCTTYQIGTRMFPDSRNFIAVLIMLENFTALMLLNRNFLHNCFVHKSTKIS